MLAWILLHAVGLASWSWLLWGRGAHLLAGERLGPSGCAPWLFDLLLFPWWDFERFTRDQVRFFAMCMLPLEAALFLAGCFLPEIRWHLVGLGWLVG